eukprot:1484725-Prymnesium_polylepis.1
MARRIGIQSKHVLYQGNRRRPSHLLRTSTVCASDRARPRPRLRATRGYTGSRGRIHCPSRVAHRRRHARQCYFSGDDGGYDSVPVLVGHEGSDTAAGHDQPADATGEALRTQVPPLADETGINSFSPYAVTRGEQARDPSLHLIVSQLKSGRNRVGVMSQLQRIYEMNDGLLYRRSVSHEGEPCLKLMVPRHGVGPLLQRFHFASHRGREPLYEEVSSNFHWDGIKQDCTTFTNACAVCGATRSRTMVKAPVMP